MLGSSLYNALCEPEFTSDAVFCDNGMEIGDQEPNPYYVSGAKRELFQFGVDALPTGQAILLANQELEHPARSLCAAALLQMCIRDSTKVLSCSATAYTTEGFTEKHNASGNIARVGTVAVDPKVIPLGTALYIVTDDGEYIYGYCIAEDTGGAVKGLSLIHISSCAGSG